MNSSFDFSPGSWAAPLAIVLVGVLAALAWQGMRAPHLVRIGVRNVPRRFMRTVLIVFGLMLSTTFVAAAITIDDTIVLAVKTVSVYNLGRIDEEVVSRAGGAFGIRYGQTIRDALASDADVAGIVPAVEMHNLLLADETARQVRGSVTGVGVDPATGGSLTDLHTSDGKAAPVQALKANEIYLNANLGKLLNAHPGDTISLYSADFPGQRHQVRVRAIVSGGFLGGSPTFVAPLASMQKLADVGDSGITVIYIANSGNGLTGVGQSDAVAARIRAIVPPFYLHVNTVKQEGVEQSLQAQDIFGRILMLFTLFVFAIGLLLIFLIFTLLATERRSELGMARALGMRRWQVVQTLLFEGLLYDGAAALLGMLSGLGLGVLIVKLVSPVVAQLGFPLQIDINLSGMVVSFCAGALFTLATIALAAWTVSRMTIAAALRDQPEPPSPHPTLGHLLGAATQATRRGLASPRGAVAAVGAWLVLVGGLVERGPLPLALGFWLMNQGTTQRDAVRFSLGVSVALVGVMLTVRWLALAVYARMRQTLTPWQMAHARLGSDRLVALGIGGGLALYWSLPFDVLQGLGVARFTGGILMFFIAGVMMVFGAVVALAPNLDLLLAPLRWLLMRLGRLRHVNAVALLYPAYHRFRTGTGLALFALVCFTVVVMDCIAASTIRSYDNLPTQTGGYDIAGQALFTPVGGLSKLEKQLKAKAPGSLSNLAAISTATPVPLGVIQPGATYAGWRLYPGAAIGGSFLDGVGLPLVARASGYASDGDVWQIVRTHPGYVVIDASALSQHDVDLLGLPYTPTLNATQLTVAPMASGLPSVTSLDTLTSNTATSVAATTGGGNLNTIATFARNPSLASEYTLRLSDIVTAPRTIAPTTLWVTDARGGASTRVTVVGVVDNTQGQRYGIFGTSATFAPIEKGLQPFGNDYYYFKVKSGVDPHSEAFALGSALIGNGFETSVLEDLLLDVNGPRVFISRVLVWLVTLTLFVGAAALAVTGSRAVVERRQQIGMLRALGFRSMHVQLMFLIEAVLVGVTGTAIGAGMGLLLCRNIFAVDFFEELQTGLALVVPWWQLGLMCGAALLATLLASLVPVWQAGRIAPADALRYE